MENRYYLLHQKELAKLLGRDENDPLYDYRHCMSAPLVRRDDGVFGNLTDNEWENFVSRLMDSDPLANEISDIISDYFLEEEKIMSYYTSEPGAYEKKDYVPVKVTEEVYRTKIINIPRDEFEEYKAKWDKAGFVSTEDTVELYEKYNTVSQAYITGHSVIRTYIETEDSIKEYDNDGMEVLHGHISRK